MSFNRDGYRKCVGGVCVMEYYSATKNNEIMPFAATWMNLEILILSEVSETEKENYPMTSLICENKKETIQMSLLTKQKQIQESLCL